MLNNQLETERLILRNYHETDLVNLHTLKSNSSVWMYSDKDVLTDIEETKKYLDITLQNYKRSKFEFQVLYLKNTEEYIGEAGILSYRLNSNRGVLGYNLLPEYWGNGYATEITKSLVKYSFEVIKMERVEALVADGNVSSRRVLEKSGFTLEGILRNYARIKNNYCNVYYYGMIRKEYYH
jgi:ribosomal-protein-alanine N-acetyltransferase